MGPARNTGDIQLLHAALASNREAFAAFLGLIGNPGPGKPDDISNLAKTLDAIERRRLQSWRAAYERSSTFQASVLATQTLASCEVKMVEMCKAKMLTEEDVMALTYTLYAHKRASAQPSDHAASVTARVMYASILLDKRGLDRITNHNWFVAKARGDEFLLEYGEKIEKLLFPLFPPMEAFHALNQQLLFTVDDSVTGGSTADSRKLGQAFFRQSGSLEGGALPFPVNVDALGSAFVDLQPVGDHAKAVDMRLAALERHASTQPQPTPQRARGRGRGGGRGAAPGARGAGPDTSPGKSDF
jgi:hypothetical protein